MKKLLYSVLFIVFLILAYTVQNVVSALPNPWIDCGDDIYCGAKKAGFNLPLRVKDYSVRAMDGLLEINFPLDKKRNVTLRKSEQYDNNLSGVYEIYPINKTLTLNNGVMFNVRGDKKRYYVVNFAAETGYYSIYSKEGMKLNDIEYFYKLLEEAEAPRNSFDEKNNYTIEQLRNLRRSDGIVEPVYTQDCFPRTLQKKGVTKDCFERANLGQDSLCSMSEFRMIKEYYKKGVNSDSQGCAINISGQ